jgi:hypothetical protein
MIKRRGPPSQEWRTFLRNHAPDIAAMDLFVVPTIGFDLLYAFVIVRLGRRDLVWINVTTNPTAEWIARQLTEAFPWNAAPRYLIHDQDRIYGAVAICRMRAMGIRDKPTAPASPWQNGLCRTADRIDPARVRGPFHRLRRVASTPHPANLRSLLQSHQNALVIGQRCAGLSPRSADWINKFTRDPWRTSSPLRPGLGFRYTQEETFLNTFVIPKVYDALSQYDGMNSVVARKAFLVEGYKKLKTISSGTPMRSQVHPFSKGIGTTATQIFLKWQGHDGSPFTQSFPDFAIREPFPFKIVFEGKYFSQGSQQKAERDLVNYIYEAFFYRALPYAPPGNSGVAWDYEFSCLIACDVSHDGTLKSAWNSLPKRVKNEFWNGGNVYVMILRPNS